MVESLSIEKYFSSYCGNVMNTLYFLFSRIRSKFKYMMYRVQFM